MQVKDALAAVEKLHNHVLREGDGGVAVAAAAKGKKAKAGASSGTLLWARQVSGEGAHLKKWRLILRNLPFNVRPPASVHGQTLPTLSQCFCCAARPCHVLGSDDMLAESCGSKHVHCHLESPTALEQNADCW